MIIFPVQSYIEDNTEIRFLCNQGLRANKEDNFIEKLMFYFYVPEFVGFTFRLILYYFRIHSSPDIKSHRQNVFDDRPNREIIESLPRYRFTRKWNHNSYIWQTGTDITKISVKDLYSEKKDHASRLNDLRFIRLQ